MKATFKNGELKIGNNSMNLDYICEYPVDNFPDWELEIDGVGCYYTWVDLDNCINVRVRDVKNRKIYLKVVKIPPHDLRVIKSINKESVKYRDMLFYYACKYLKLKQGVYIEWCDAISYQKKNWVDIEEAKNWAKNSNWVVKQLGFVIEETDKYILLATEFTEVENELPDLGGVIKIPTTWILKRVNINI